MNSFVYFELTNLNIGLLFSVVQFVLFFLLIKVLRIGQSLVHKHGKLNQFKNQCGQSILDTFVATLDENFLQSEQ